VFCIFLFLGAASIFGTLVSQINEIVASQTTISKELDKVLEAYFSIQPRQEKAFLLIDAIGVDSTDIIFYLQFFSINSSAVWT
jgi:hypothetical protein